MPDMKPLELLSQLHGEFDGFTLHGYRFKFHGEHRTGWKITSESKLGGVKHYWVEHDKFHTVVSHTATEPTRPGFLDIGSVIDVKEAEKAAISRAVERWTQEYHDKIIAES